MIRCSLVYGLGGVQYSSGLGKLAVKLRDLDKTISADMYHYTEGEIVKELIITSESKHEENRYVLVGHSLGANTCAWISRNIKGASIDLIASFDAGGWFTGDKTVEGNVNHVINFVSTNWWNLLGHGVLRRGTKFTGSMETYDTPLTHILVDDNPEFHNKVLDAVKKLI